ncbi:hypothetical protein ACIGCZ_37375 [Streptomyces nigra]|uniref:hypothetical protein n=1 Tax=Streptomyces nigra TaxID=1827580 RepID=UPI0037D5B383
MNDDHTDALPASTPKVIVHPAADRRLAATHWLLSTLPAAGRDRARTEWEDTGVALLPLGTLFSAVRIPGRLVRALTGPLSLPETDTVLAEALRGGPVICDPHRPSYYALVPTSMPSTWKDAAAEWDEVDVAVLGRDTHLGVPRLDATELSPTRWASYWSVPMESAGVLCDRLAVARFIAAARHVLEALPEAEVSPVWIREV